MKILYGIQATGNGHLSRAREMAKYFAKTDIHVDYLISGRKKSALHDMEVFGNYMYRQGLTFITQNGSVDPIKTALNFKPLKLFADAKKLDLEPYDLIISDFEPVTAWAAKLKGRQCMGIGHQYSFNKNTPRAKGKWFSLQILKYFAPADIKIGLHWHKFNHFTLPPIIDFTLKPSSNHDTKKIVVYLPFCNQETIIQLLMQIPDFDFYQYSPDLTHENRQNMHLRPTSVENFHNDLSTCDGVICNTGFELISECLHLGIPVLTTPLVGQVEQLSNAIALETLKLAEVTAQLSTTTIKKWLEKKQRQAPKQYPDVAKSLVSWIQQGQPQPISSLCNALWLQSGITP